MRGTVNHPLPDQIGAYRPQGGDLGTQAVGYIPGPVWSASDLCHGAQVLLLLGSQSVKAHSKKILIKTSGHNICRLVDDPAYTNLYIFIKSKFYTYK
ncbi:MAG: hypothetical protein FD120_1256 [Gammaproteobacteria bacterium]|nr:MAG: hypothetical protein FD120_1256 [Gammaproteobacteria bacterium]